MKRAQVAMEFLSNYGFSFMIILAAMGGLFYFGVFDLSSYVPSTCDLGTTVFCPLYTLEKDYDNGLFAVNIELSNLGENRLTIANMSIKDGDQETFCFSHDITDSSGGALTAEDFVLGSRQDREYTFEFEDGHHASHPYH